MEGPRSRHSVASTSHDGRKVGANQSEMKKTKESRAEQGDNKQRDPLEIWLERVEKVWFLLEGVGSLYGAWYMTVKEHKGTTLLQAVRVMDPQIQWNKVAFGCLCVTMNTCLMLFYTMYLPWIKKIPVNSEQWRRVAPWTFPSAAIAAFMAVVSFVWALWPLQGVYSLITTIAYTLSTLTVLQVLPNWGASAKGKQE